MGELGAFLKLDRVENPERAPQERVHDYHEFVRTLAGDGAGRSRARAAWSAACPFCHNGCPVNNLIPDWNDLVYRDRWEAAIEQLHRTNNFPDFTGPPLPGAVRGGVRARDPRGRGGDDQADRARDREPRLGRGLDPARSRRRARRGRSVAVIGAGPAGMACAQQLRRAGHAVTVFERDEAGGGLVRFGVPDFKIEKWIVERRVEQLAAEGVEFRFGVDVGGDVPVEELRAFDAVVIATGSRVPRDLPVPGRELARRPLRDGLPLPAQPLRRPRGGPDDAAARPSRPAAPAVITAAGKHVIVIGGGDTGADCVANAHREGAASVTQIELIGEPPRSRPDEVTPWPLLADEAAHPVRAQGGRRARLRDLDHAVHRLERTRRADPLGPERGHAAVRADRRHRGDAAPPASCCSRWASSARSSALLEQLGVERDERTNVKAPRYETSVPGVFAAGDARRGQSLIVWAINEGRRCAQAVERHLAKLPVGAG